MKRSIALLTIAAALFAVSVMSMPAAFAQDGHEVIVPASSIEHPWDIGVRAHTNIILVKLDQSETEGGSPPIAENPGSLACIYHLVKQTKGCPKTSNILPNGGTK